MTCERCEKKPARKYAAKDDMWYCPRCYELRYPEKFEEENHVSAPVVDPDEVLPNNVWHFK